MAIGDQSTQGSASAYWRGLRGIACPTPSPVTLQSLGSQRALREHVVGKGCYSHEENLRIYEKWFANSPRLLFNLLDQRYGLCSKTVCDVGCAYGMNLAFCRPGSYGIEIEEYECRFAGSIGLKICRKDVISDDLSDMPRVEAVWNCNVLEHVVAPHVLLRKLHRLLLPGGWLFLLVPVVPLFPSVGWCRPLRRYVHGFWHDDHVNAFTPPTLRCFCEFAGFQTVHCGIVLPAMLRWLEPLVTPLSGLCVYVGRRKDSWEYPPRSTRRVAANRDGFVFNGQRFPCDGRPT